ncbi:hypothetical protein [Mycobacterium vicinigordonae]|uniref:Uncharacterized protein n=1 Tax=Mycobacterium vicinigordonae TaxID=1719132 RepID=A0A7D6I2F3_9MYCO|nr:hypothetical protein [Mycobacterium vicinigordonae]QLL08494.1 hypothetical protein H0P51_06030 [Mycobacterium vicinigordonae]
MKHLIRAASTLGRTADLYVYRNRPQIRTDHAARYAFLESSSMARAMDRL